MSSRTRLVLRIVAVVAAAAFAVYWFVLRSDAPPPVDIDAAVESVTSTAAAGSTDATTAPAAVSPGGDSVEGTWVVDTSSSFVGYRVREELANIGFTEAVGRTSALEGQLVVAGTGVASVDVVADLTRLQSDESRRDRAIRRQALETDRFPEATFSLVEPIDLGAIPEPGTTVSFSATGDLTIHGVTNRVTIPFEGQLIDGKVVVVGSVPIVFTDYGIDPPSAAIVLSVEDHGVMEFQLVFTR